MNPDPAADLRALEQRLGGTDQAPGWAKPTPSIYPEPTANFEPHVWSWEAGRASLVEAGDLVDVSLAERRNLILVNPVEGNTYGSLRTLVAAYQSIHPGEQARSHRHTPNALRLILEGDGLYTIVDGVRVSMNRNDVVITPQWMFHGHGSVGAGPGFWIDVLDAPLVHLLEPMFAEQHPDVYEPVVDVLDDTPLLFSWERTAPLLAASASDPDRRWSARLDLDTPMMASVSLALVAHEAGTRSTVDRCSANRLYCVMEGAGSSEVGGRRLDWRRGDVIAAPLWREVSHTAERDTTMLEISDGPVMAAFGWFREQIGR